MHTHTHTHISRRDWSDLNPEALSTASFMCYSQTQTHIQTHTHALLHVLAIMVVCSPLNSFSLPQLLCRPTLYCHRLHYQETRQISKTNNLSSEHSNKRLHILKCLQLYKNHMISCRLWNGKTLEWDITLNIAGCNHDILQYSGITFLCFIVRKHVNGLLPGESTLHINPVKKQIYGQLTST